MYILIGILLCIAQRYSWGAKSAFFGMECRHLNEWYYNQGENVMSHTGKRESDAEVMGLQGLVEYQNGTVVSRTLINKEIGTVTLFAFDAGEGLSEHTAPFDALVYVFDGEADIVISGTSFQVKQGEMIIMPADKPHELKAVKRFKMMLVMIRS